MAKVKVTLTTPNLYETEGVRLIAGDNFVESENLVKFLANSCVQHDISVGIIVVEKEKVAVVEDKFKKVK